MWDERNTRRDRPGQRVRLTEGVFFMTEAVSWRCHGGDECYGYAIKAHDSAMA